MSDIAASERRLAAALDRIDYILEHSRGPEDEGGAAPAAAEDAALRNRLEDARAENARLTAELQRLQDRQRGASDETLAQAHERLTGAGREAARLAAANDDLAAANRALIAAQAGRGDGDAALRAAYEAEIESLRAARAAEIAQMGDIMAELERLLGAEGETVEGAAPGPGPDRASGRPAGGSGAADASGDAGGVPELRREQDPGFGAVYGDATDDDFGAGRDDEDSEGR